MCNARAGLRPLHSLPRQRQRSLADACTSVTTGQLCCTNCDDQIPTFHSRRSCSNPATVGGECDGEQEQQDANGEKDDDERGRRERRQEGWQHGEDEDDRGKKDGVRPPVCRTRRRGAVGSHAEAQPLRAVRLGFPEAVTCFQHGGELGEGVAPEKWGTLMSQDTVKLGGRHRAQPMVESVGAKT